MTERLKLVKENEKHYTFIRKKTYFSFWSMVGTACAVVTPLWCVAFLIWLNSNTATAWAFTLLLCWGIFVLTSLKEQTDSIDTYETEEKWEFEKVSK